ncbi:MAG: pgk [Rickettsiales bacterium]|jgi:phosphoglycerate kinase|nr:pgk [Rickettsiales bacterium]
MTLKTLHALDVSEKTVLVRVDLNVPMKHGKVEDNTRINRLIPTLKYLLDHDAKVVVLSHFGRPEGEFVRDMSLAPLANELGRELGNIDVKFAVDCIGHHAEEAVASLKPGDILLLENLRFHKGEEENDPVFVKALAKLGEYYVNDTFSCSHRAHASIVGLAEKLPSAAGFLLQEEIENLERVLEAPERPITAIVGGSKVSTKLAVLENLIPRVNCLIIGGAMANTFLFAKGYAMGTSRLEADLKNTALDILKKAAEQNCEIILPTDAVCAKAFAPHVECTVVPAEAIPSDQMMLDLGPDTIIRAQERIRGSKTVIWNGPLGAFEIAPFDTATVSLSRTVASLTRQKKLTSVGGGGDIVAALKHAGLTQSFTYISTAGGAFLEWLEGKELPGVAVLKTGTNSHQKRA